MNLVDGFDDIYRDYAAAVYRFCVRAVSRPEVAEDITSEVFLALHQSLPNIPRDQIPAWLFTVAKRRAADYWRHHYVELRWSAANVSAEATQPAQEFSLETLLQRCPSLKPAHRLCIILRFRHGMSRTEIARDTGLSELQVKGNLQYALQLLRESIASRSPTPGVCPTPQTSPLSNPR